MNIYYGEVTKLLKDQIFVFGSNTEGRHGKGAALFAKKYCGAVYGQARGIQGNSYAIVTKDLTAQYQPSRTPTQIISEIVELYDYANNHPWYEFVVAYSGIGVNLNFYTNENLASFFMLATKDNGIPNNMTFSNTMYNLIKAQYEIKRQQTK